MATKEINATGVRCPQPVMKMSAALMGMNAGDIIEVVADCPTFEEDVKKWCERLKKDMLWVRQEDGGKKRIQVKV